MSRQPYIGLRAFSREEQALFFGREQHSNELIERLNRQHFLAVVGASGCGKSSLIKAGLIPGLQAGFLTAAGSHWRIAEARPGNDPFANLAEALCKDTALGVAYQNDLAEKTSLTRSPFSLHELLAENPLPNNAKLLIVCDQFEELFRYSRQQTSSEEAAAFAALLLASANPYPLSNGEVSNSVYVILTMRSDYLGNCAQFAGLAEAINQGLYLTPRLNRQQLRSAIERPALVCNGKVEPALLVKLLGEIGNDADQLPLLQHVLMRLWDKAANAGSAEEPSPSTAEDAPHASVPPIVVKLADYEDESIQTLKNALSTHVDEAYDELSDSQKPIAKQIFCRLTGAETGKADTRNPTKVSDLMDLTGQDLEQLAAVLKPFRQTGRCLLLPPLEVELKPDTVLDITHESLIRNWERLDKWTQEEAESATIYRRLEQNALLHEKKQYGFYRTPELENALVWQENTQPTPAWANRYGEHFELAMAFLQRSLLEQQAEQERERLAQQREIERQQAEQEKERLAQQREIERQQAEQERERQRGIEKANLKQRFLLTGLVLALVLSGWAWKERHHANVAEKQRTVDLFQSRLTHASLLAKGEDYLGAKQVLKETDALDKEITPAMFHARNLLRSFAHIMGGEAEKPIYEGAGYPLFTTAISPDGTLLAAGGEHGTLVVFDTASGQLLQRLEGHATEDYIFNVAFTPQGDYLISAGDDKKIILWQRQGQRFKQQRGLDAPGKTKAIAISSDGKILASGGDDKAISLWEFPSGKPIKPLKKHVASISFHGLAFNDKGDLLASGSNDGTVIIWELATGKPLHILDNFGAAQVVFSADGQTLASASGKIVNLWDVKNGQIKRTLEGHTNQVFAVQFIGNGDNLLSGGDNLTVRLWDSQTGVTLRYLQGHEAAVLDFAIYGDTIFTASADGTLRRWGLILPYQQRVALANRPLSNAITPNLNQVAVGFENGSLGLYDMENQSWADGKENAPAHSGQIYHLTFNNKGTLLATAGFADKIAKVWEVKQNQLKEQQSFSGHTGAVYSVAISPDSQTLATVSSDEQIGLFKIDGKEKPIFIERAHDDGGANSISFSNDGKQLLSSGVDKLIKLWNIQTSPPTNQTLLKANDKLSWASWSPDNQWIAAVGREQAVNVYATVSNERKYHLVGHENTVYKAIFSPDSRQLATVSYDTTAKFWDIEQGKLLFSLRLPMRPKDDIWDFDFRCQAANCLMAVPLVRGVLQLYQFSYEGKPQLDPPTEKRALLPLWQSYLDTVQIHLDQHALQPALQTLRETEQIASHYPAQLGHDADYEALKKRGDCQQQKVQQLLKRNGTPFNVECENILNGPKTADQVNILGVGYYKQKQYSQAQTTFAKGLEQFPTDLPLLSNDSELALVQGDKQRMQQRLNLMQPLYSEKDGVYSDQYPAIMQFLLFLSNDKQTPESVLSVIAQTDKSVNFDWDFSDIQPVLKKQSPAKQKIAKLFINFFQKRFNLQELKIKLAALEKKPGNP